MLYMDINGRTEVKIPEVSLSVVLKKSKEERRVLSVDFANKLIYTTKDKYAGWVSFDEVIFTIEEAEDEEKRVD